MGKTGKTCWGGRNIPTSMPATPLYNMNFLACTDDIIVETVKCFLPSSPSPNSINIGINY